MYDVNGNGYIDLQEMTQIVRSIYHLIGKEQVFTIGELVIWMNFVEIENLLELI